MSKLYLASIDLNKIDKTKIKTFERKNGEKGKSLDVAIWIDENPDEDWKACNIQQSTKKDEDKIYLGNGKLYNPQGESSTQSSSSSADDGDDLPF